MASTPPQALDELLADTLRNGHSKISTLCAREREKVSSELLECTKLEDDWDGHGGHAPALIDVVNAVSFIRHLPDDAMAKVQVMVSGDGDVGFEWGRNIDLEIGFRNEHISFCGDHPEGATGKGNSLYACRVPHLLQQLLDEFFNSSHPTKL